MNSTTIMTRPIDWSMDFSNEAVIDKWCRDYHRGFLVDAPKVRQFIGAPSLFWNDGMRTLLRQCFGILRKRMCDRQAKTIDGAEKSLFSLREIVRLVRSGSDMVENDILDSLMFESDGFLDDTLCVMSYGKEEATVICWCGTDISYDMMCLCDTFGFDVSMFPEKRYGNAYDITIKYRKEKSK